MSKVTLGDFGSDYQSKQLLNSNNTVVETAFDNTLSRDGTGPNQMQAAFDVNGHRILNLPTPVNPTDPVRLEDINSATAISVLATSLITPETYGATGNALQYDDGAIANTSKNFSSAGATFTSADVGKLIAIMGAGVAGATLITTIATFTSAHAVVLTAAASTTVTGKHFVYGSDDTTALTAFFASGKTVLALSPNKGYITTAGVTCNAKMLTCFTSPIYFLIGDHVTDCFNATPPSRMTVSQIASKFLYKDMYLDAMATGRDLMVVLDGSPATDGLTLDNAYRDAYLAKSVQANQKYIENLNGQDWIFRNVGRHGLHLYLDGGGSVSNYAFINETHITAWEIRGLGQRFSVSNAVRITHDNCLIGGQSKVSGVFINGVNWDCDVAASLSGTGVGTPIYASAINGTTYRRVEAFNLRNSGGIESTTGSFGVVPLFIDGSNFTAGDWIESCIDQGVPFNWGYGCNTAFLSQASDRNEYIESSALLGRVYMPMILRPGGYYLHTTDASPLGGFIDPTVKNVIQPYVAGSYLTASATVNIDVAMQALFDTGIPASYTQWPLKVFLSNNPFFNDPTKWSFGSYNIFISYTGGTAYITSTTSETKVGADLTYTFNPAVGVGVAFSVQSSSGSKKDILRISVTGGANVATGGADQTIVTCVSRFGMGLSEYQRQYKGGVGTDYNFRV